MNIVKYITAACIAACMVACASRDASPAPATNVGETLAPGYLHIDSIDGYTDVVVLNPWHDGDTLGHYALVGRGDSVSLPPGITRVNVPIRRAVVFSMVHTSAIDELGAADCIVAVADPDFFAPDDPLRARIDNGSVASVGSSMSPSVEAVIALAPDAVLLSPMESGSADGIIRAGLPVIYMADYMETTPLQRAAWLRLLGLLTGCDAAADSIVDAVSHRYAELSALAASATTRPVALVERPYSGVWYIPAGDSYKAAMLADAGAVYPWADTQGRGSLQLSEEAVMARAADADIWLLSEQGDASPESLAAAMPHSRAFTAFPEGIFYTNSLESPMFRDIAFHPERVLADMVALFHPELADSLPPLRYYKPLKQ